jgi:hypothetical protein
MIFLIEYNRKFGKLVSFESFVEKDWQRAEALRFERELALNLAGIENTEVVLLEAASEQIVRRTHRRYFEDLEQLATLPEAA